MADLRFLRSSILYLKHIALQQFLPEQRADEQQKQAPGSPSEMRLVN